MFKAKKLTGLALAAAAAGIFASTAMTTVMAKDAAEDKVKCEGINGCKGQGKCATKTNSCAGHNACKGKGWIETTARECESQGGKPYVSNEK
jgi:hypothetical protein